MAIKFEDARDDKKGAVVKKAEKAKPRLDEALSETSHELTSELPFAKAVRPEKKGRRK